jgi:signal transduction histidine kinase
MKLPLLTVEIRAEQHVVLARQRARKIAALLGLDLREQTYLATAVSELARNALQYGGGGRATFSVQATPALYQIEIQDEGPGIADLPAILEGRYVSKTGMGIGITGSRRLVDQFDIASSPRTGTTATLGKWLPAEVPITAHLLSTVTAELAKSVSEEPLAEVQQQNQELLATLSELRIRQREVEELNAALNEANQALVAQRLELQHADRAKTEFLAVLAHELRNPLGALSNALYLAELPSLAAETKEHYCNVARRQTRQLGRLVEDLLDVSRITQGKVELRREPMELAQILADAVESSRAGMEARGQHFTSSGPAGQIFLDADAARLTQVFTNLLTNAVKFTPNAGLIWLKVSLPAECPDRVEVSIRDSGSGIPGQLLDRVFDLFAQAPQTLARSQGGLGIGLMLVRSLVELHGGTVRVSSGGQDRGAEFTVSLPVLPGHHSAAPAAVTTEHRRNEKTLRVLVVDDHADAADTLGEILETWGHTVRLARDGLQALSAAREDLPDWVVCDLGLPGLDGYAVAAALRLEPITAQIRLVALTGYGGVADLAATRAAGFEAHLTKPVDLAALRLLLQVT